MGEGRREGNEKWEKGEGRATSKNCSRFSNALYTLISYSGKRFTCGPPKVNGAGGHGTEELPDPVNKGALVVAWVS